MGQRMVLGSWDVVAWGRLYPRKTGAILVDCGSLRAANVKPDEEWLGH